VSFNPRADDESIRMNSIAYEYASSITGEIFIAEGVCQQNRDSKRSVGYYLAHVLLTLRQLIPDAATAVAMHPPGLDGLHP
jgi:hypothetical protein